jgi:O-antigen/teichoic acid export membrane protein
MQLNALVSFAVFGGLAAVAADLVPFAFGAKWQPAGSMCALLSIYALVNSLEIFFHPALIASGGPGAYVLLNVLHAIGVAGACLLGIRFGISALIAGLIANGIIVAIPALFFLRQRIGLSILAYCRPCAVPLLASALMDGGVWLVRSMLIGATPPMTLIVAEMAAGAAVYISVTCLLNPKGARRTLDVIGHVVGRGPAHSSSSPIANAVV